MDVKNVLLEFIKKNSFTIIIVVVSVIALLIVIPKSINSVIGLFSQTLEERMDSIETRTRQIDSLRIELRHYNEEISMLMGQIDRRDSILVGLSNKLKTVKNSTPKVTNPDSAEVLIRRFINE